MFEGSMTFWNMRRCSFQSIRRTTRRRFLSLRPWMGGRKKDLFLNVWREIEQLHDLRHAGSRHLTAAGQFRIVANRFPRAPALQTGSPAP